MANQKISSRKTELITRIINHRKSTKLLLALLEHDEPVRYRDLKVPGGTDKILYIIGLIEKESDENGVVKIGLTKNGRKIAKPIKEIFDSMDDILPGV